MRNPVRGPIVADLDGVTFDSVEVYQEVGRELAERYEWSEFNPDVYGFDLIHEHFVMVQNEMLRRGMMETFVIFPDTKEFLLEAHERGHELDYNTARNHYTVDPELIPILHAQTRNALIKNGLPQHENLFFSYPKLPVCQQRGAIVLLEDSHHTCEEFHSQRNCNNVIIRAWLISRPHNRHSTYPFRVDSPQELWDRERYLKRG